MTDPRLAGSMTGDTSSTQRTESSGIALLLAAGILWSLNGALIKLIYDEGRGPHGITIAFYRSLFAGLFLLPMAWGRFHTLRTSRPSSSVSDLRIDGKLRSSARRTLHDNADSRGVPRAPVAVAGSRGPFSKMPAARGRIQPAAIWCVIFFALMTVCFVVANTKTEAANAILLQYTSTFWVFGLSPWLLKERPAAREFRFLALAMLGIAIIFAGNASTDLIGLLIALAAGLFFGLLTLMIRRLRHSDSAAITVLNNLGSALLLLPAAVLVGDLTLSPRAWLLIIFMGAIQLGLPYYLYALGLARVEAHRAALVTMIEPVLVPVWAYLAVHETVPGMTMAGGALILIALVLFIRSARRGSAADM